MPSRFSSNSYSLLIHVIAGRFCCCGVIALGLLLFTNCTMRSIYAIDLDAVKPVPPDVSEASDEAEQSMAGITIPDGWNIQLFAAEPDVANVVAFDIDHRGRVFVCESFRQNRGVTDNRAHDEQWVLADLAAETVQDRINYHKKLLGDAAVTYAQHDDRIRRVTDSNGDGKADESQVVADGFHHIEEGTGAGVLVRGSDIYYTCIPKLWKLVDKDDDGKADERVVLSNGYGVRVAFRGHDMHGIMMGPDGRLYFSIGDRGYHIMTTDGQLISNPAVGAVFRCELDGTGLEVFANGLRNPQELAFNDVGDLFSVDNNSDSGDMARIVHILRGGDTGWRMHYQYLPDRGPFNQEKIWEPFHNEQPAYIVPPIANFTDGPSGLAYYPGTGFGDQLNDQFLICDFRGGPSNSGVRSFRLDPDGAFYKLAEDDQPIWTCLATDVAFGPDGAIYVSDWVDGWEGLGKGRIYRLTDPNHVKSEIVEEVQQLLPSDWTSRDADQLADDLRHLDRRVRLESQWELARRTDVPRLTGVAQESEGERKSRLHAIWGLDQIARLHEDKRASALESIRPLLIDADPFVRAAAAKVAGERTDADALPALRKALVDDSPRVRYFAAMALGQLKDSESMPAVVAMLAKNDNTDPALRHAGMMFLVGAAKPNLIVQLKSHQNVSVRRTAVVALRRLKSGSVSDFLDDSEPLVAAEAARAIHDVPIAVSLPQLADRLDNGSKDLSFIRRSLNANFRVGTVEAAQRVAKYTANAKAPIQMRSEALAMLSQWAKPDPRDRVLNAYRPLDPRDAKIAGTALLPHIDSLMITDSTVRENMIDVASKLGIKKIAPELSKRVRDDSQSASMRANALTALSRLDPVLAVQLARSVKLSPSSDLVPAALKVLAVLDQEKSLETFINATESSDLQVQQLGWDILAKI
ncbi:MAG: glucose dehydrogenase, partial [Pirellulaceae bacterium]|nr:glucose dehydrogenase [Pirellulaceae bacterium]